MEARELRREQGEETLLGLRADTKCLPVTKRKGKVQKGKKEKEKKGRGLQEWAGTKA